MRIIFSVDSILAQSTTQYWVEMSDGTVLFIPVVRAHIDGEHLLYDFPEGEHVYGAGGDHVWHCDARYIPDDYPGDALWA